MLEMSKESRTFLYGESTKEIKRYKTVLVLYGGIIF